MSTRLASTVLAACGLSNDAVNALIVAADAGGNTWVWSNIDQPRPWRAAMLLSHERIVDVVTMDVRCGFDKQGKREVMAVVGCAGQMKLFYLDDRAELLSAYCYLPGVQRIRRVACIGAERICVHCDGCSLLVFDVSSVLAEPFDPHSINTQPRWAVALDCAAHAIAVARSRSGDTSMVLGSAGWLRSATIGREAASPTACRAISQSLAELLEGMRLVSGRIDELQHRIKQETEQHTALSATVRWISSSTQQPGLYSTVRLVRHASQPRSTVSLQISLTSVAAGLSMAASTLLLCIVDRSDQLNPACNAASRCQTFAFGLGTWEAGCGRWSVEQRVDGLRRCGSIQLFVCFTPPTADTWGMHGCVYMHVVAYLASGGRSLCSAR